MRTYVITRRNAAKIRYTRRIFLSRTKYHPTECTNLSNYPTETAQNLYLLLANRDQVPSTRRNYRNKEKVVRRATILLLVVYELAMLNLFQNVPVPFVFLLQAYKVYHTQFQLRSRLESSN